MDNRTRSITELQNVTTEADSMKKVLKMILQNILSVKHVAEDSYLEATRIEDEDIKTTLLSHLEGAVSQLDNAYNLGLVTLKENVELALRLAGEEEDIKENTFQDQDSIVKEEENLGSPLPPYENVSELFGNDVLLEMDYKPDDLEEVIPYIVQQDHQNEDEGQENINTANLGSGK